MDYDIVVIGSGPGGYVAAIRAAQLGKKVAVVERAELGGVCLNWGCIPTKALLKSAQVYGYAANAGSFGVEVEGGVKPDMPKVVARSRAVAETMSKGVAFLLNKNKIDVIHGHAVLLDGGRVGVSSNEGVVEYSAAHIILATGARQKEIAAIPIDGHAVINAKQALLLERVPESVVVVGSGAIGCEFAWYFAALGSKVTLIEYLPDILPLEDEEVSKYMDRSFRKLRATVMTSAAVKSVAVKDGRCLIEVESAKCMQIIESEIVLSAVGINANIEGIGLEAAGVASANGKITVDEFYRTNMPGVYAVGDIVPGPALAHVASAEAICCVEKICGLEPEPVDYATIPSCVYTAPEVASVGITEKQARGNGLEVRIGKFLFTASGKAASAGDRDGFVKLIFDAATDKLLGAHMVGANVTEMVAELTLAKRTGVISHILARTIHPHPTMGEAISEAAEAATGQAIHL